MKTKIGQLGLPGRILIEMGIVGGIDETDFWRGCKKSETLPGRRCLEVPICPAKACVSSQCLHKSRPTEVITLGLCTRRYRRQLSSGTWARSHTHTHLRNKAVRALNTRPTPRLLHTAHPDFARLVTSGSMQVCAERSGLLIETGIVEVSMLDVVGRAVKSEKCLLALCAFTCRTCVFFDFLLLSFLFSNVLL